MENWRQMPMRSGGLASISGIWGTRKNTRPLASSGLNCSLMQKARNGALFDWRLEVIVRMEEVTFFFIIIWAGCPLLRIPMALDQSNISYFVYLEYSVSAEPPNGFRGLPCDDSQWQWVCQSIWQLDSPSVPQVGLVYGLTCPFSLKWTGRHMAIGPSDSPAIPALHILFFNMVDC